MNIDVFGVAAGQTGWATHSLGFARALNEIANVSFRPHYRSRLNALKLCVRMQPREIFLRGSIRPPGEFGVVILGRPYKEQKSARWIVWETTRLPEKVRRECDSASFVWTPSSWGRQTLIENGVAAERVSVVPEGVDADFFRPAEQSRPSGPFRFLFVGKWETRKFVGELTKAFADEFSDKDDVELVLHAHNTHVPDLSARAELQRLAVPSSARVILSEPGPSQDLRRLYQSADVFVFPTRAEGWGLPILEAMASGVPAIVTRHSAPMDFVSDDVGYLLNVRRMVDAHCDMFGIHTGQWAEPDVEHLRFLMRHAYENREEARLKGLRARDQAVRWSWMNSARIGLQAIRSAVAG